MKYLLNLKKNHKVKKGDNRKFHIQFHINLKILVLGFLDLLAYFKLLDFQSVQKSLI